MTDYKRIDREEGYATIKNCGCWIINLAQGKAVFPCKEHQPKVLSCLETKESEYDRGSKEQAQISAKFYSSRNKTKNKTKEEIKGMEEMECWSCDNHLNICDKHIFTDVEHEALTEVYRAKVGTPLQKALVDNPEAQKQLAEAILAVKNKATPKDCGCFESKSGTVEMFCPKHEDKDACIEPCNHDEVCGKCGKCFPDTPTPPSKECEHGRCTGCGECLRAVQGFKQRNTIYSCKNGCDPADFTAAWEKSKKLDTPPRKKCECCESVGCRTCLREGECLHGQAKPTPPSKIDPCKGCGAKKPKFCTCPGPLPKPTRLEDEQPTSNDE